MKAGEGRVIYKHGVENEVIRNHDRNVINVEMCMQRDTAPKVVAMESVLLKVSLTLWPKLLYLLEFLENKEAPNNRFFKHGLEILLRTWNMLIFDKYL